MSKNNRGLIIAAYICCIALIIVIIVLFWKKATVEEQYGELATTQWDTSDEEDVAGIDGIVSQTEPTDVEIIEESIETQVGAEEDSASNDSDEDETEENVEIPDGTLLYNNQILTTGVDWTLIEPTKTTDTSLWYNFAGCYVSISIVEGTCDSYKQAIYNKADELGAEIEEEVVTYSPSRVYESYNYDKYTLTYTSDDEDVTAYYYLNQMDENSIYLVTIRTSESLDSESEVFGILEYHLSDIE